MFGRIQLMGGSTIFYSIEDEAVVCSDGWAGPPGAIR